MKAWVKTVAPQSIYQETSSNSLLKRPPLPAWSDQDFEEEVLREYKFLSKDDPIGLSIHRLVPELRSSVAELSRMGTTQQKRASAMLELLLADWQERETEPE